MERKFVFLGGLPRSGSTLLSNIMAQHEDVHCFGQSALPTLFERTMGTWYELPQHKQDISSAREKLRTTLGGMMMGYYQHVVEPVILEHSRGWPAQIDRLQWILRQEVKIIVPVRKIVSVLASFEKLYRSNIHNVLPQQRSKYGRMLDVEGRCSVWLGEDEPLGVSIRILRDAINRGHGKNMLLVDYDELCTHPKASMARVWAFLDMPQIEHDFSNIEQVTVDACNDLIAYGIDHLHNIESSIHIPADDAETVLGRQVYQRYKDATWKP